MIAVCPKCATRYRVADEQLARGELRLRCTRCEAVFRVRSPATAPSTPVAATGAWAAAPAASPPSGQSVVVAHPDANVGKRVVAWLVARGIDAVLVHDGVEAILALQLRLPRAAIVDAGITGLGAAQLCELVKRNAELRRIGIVIADGAVQRTVTPDGFGPDATIASERMEEDLPAALRSLGIAFSAATPAAPVAAAPTVQSVAPPPATSASAPGVAPACDDALAAERAKAERLARIIVSDVILYHEEKFARAVADGNVVRVFDGDFADGRNLFRQRIDERVRDERDFIGDELLRVARARGMKDRA